MRAIDADALIEVIDKKFQEHYGNTVYQFIHDFFRFVIKQIRKAPTIEAEPVKHGRWYDIVEFNNGERIIATCSNCKDRGELRTDRNEWGIWHINSPRCPNCGAKMEVDNG